MENKRKRYSLAVLFAIMLCFVSCVFNVHAENIHLLMLVK